MFTKFFKKNAAGAAQAVPTSHLPIAAANQAAITFAEPLALPTEMPAPAPGQKISRRKRWMRAVLNRFRSTDMGPGDDNNSRAQRDDARNVQYYNDRTPKTGLHSGQNLAHSPPASNASIDSVDDIRPLQFEPQELRVEKPTGAAPVPAPTAHVPRPLPAIPASPAPAQRDELLSRPLPPFPTAGRHQQRTVPALRPKKRGETFDVENVKDLTRRLRDLGAELDAQDGIWREMFSSVSEQVTILEEAALAQRKVLNLAYVKRQTVMRQTWGASATATPATTASPAARPVAPIPAADIAAASPAAAPTGRCGGESARRASSFRFPPLPVTPILGPASDPAGAVSTVAAAAAATTEPAHQRHEVASEEPAPGPESAKMDDTVGLFGAAQRLPPLAADQQ